MLFNNEPSNLYINETPENHDKTQVHIVYIVAIYYLTSCFLNLSGTTGLL